MAKPKPVLSLALAAKNSVLAPTAASPLLKLPLELRNQIYSYVFDSALVITKIEDFAFAESSQTVSLNQTCQPLRTETAALLMKYSALELDYMDLALTDWIANTPLGEAQPDTLLMPRLLWAAKAFQFIQYRRVNGWHDRKLVQRLFPNVQRVVMVEDYSDWDGYKNRVEEDLKRVFGRDDLVAIDE